MPAEEARIGQVILGSIQCPHCQGHIELSATGVMEDPEREGAFQILGEVFWGEDFEDTDDLEDSFNPDHPYLDAEREMLQAVHDRNPRDAQEHAHTALGNLKDFAQYMEDHPNHWFRESRLHTVPRVLTEGGRVMALVEDQEGLGKMRDIFGTIPIWEKRAGPALDELERDMVRYRNIREAVRENPDCAQTDVKYLISEVDGRKVATQIAYMDQMGQLVRTRVGRKILLNMP